MVRCSQGKQDSGACTVPELKEKRIDGLIAHAVYPISTGKLEGFNNKIKVAKRLAYGYRDNRFFFMLVRFLSVRFPNFP